MPKFIPGLELSRIFYQYEVKPILDRNFPALRYSAALIGWGSEVLGFDTALSRERLPKTSPEDWQGPVCRIARRVQRLLH
jgi:hypothetical protein